MAEMYPAFDDTIVTLGYPKPNPIRVNNSS